MNKASNSLSIMAVSIMVVLGVSLIIVPANAQTSAPSFNVEYIKEVSYIPPVTTTDPYTGNEITTSWGRAIYNETIVFTINNQAFKQLITTNDQGRYFNFKFKGHYENEWKYDPFQPDDTSVYAAGGMLTGPFPHFTASNSDYTILSFNLHRFVGYQGSNDGPAVPNGAELDFQVQAQIGTITPLEGTGSLGLGSYYKFTGQSSDWSDTQTVTISANEEPYPTPTVPEFSTTATLLLLLSAIPIITVAKRQKLTRKV